MEETIDLKEQEHNRAILKSTALLGGSSLITMLVSMVKSKIMAVLLGPEGVGFLGVLTNLQSLIITVAGLGLTSSAVRELSHAIASGNEQHIATTAKTIRTIVWLTGFLGLFITLIGARSFSKFSFNSYEYTAPIALMGISILLTVVSSGQSSILQGFRRIDLVAKINIIGAVLGALASIICFYFLRLDGVVPSLIATAAVSLVLTWFYSHKISIADTSYERAEYKDESKRLLALGMPIMLSGVLTTGTNYLIRAFLAREAGLGGVGQYQAAFSFASVLVNFVLAAMGTDYLPRLTAIADDNEKVKKEVNAQTQIALLISVPLLAATMVFMPFIVRLFYSSQFEQAIPILRWAVLGILGRIISWPMGFIMLAKSKSSVFFITELISDAMNIAATIVFYRIFGLEGSGIAFAFLYLFYIGLMLLVSRHISEFKWDKVNIRTISIAVIVVLVLFLNNFAHISMTLRYVLGIVIFLAVTFDFLLKLRRVSGIKLAHFWKR